MWQMLPLSFVIPKRRMKCREAKLPAIPLKVEEPRFEPARSGSILQGLPILLYPLSK